MSRALYACDIPLSFSLRQFPPVFDPFSKQSKSIPRACSTCAAAIPELPAPMTQAFPMPGNLPDPGRPANSQRKLAPEAERDAAVSTTTLAGCGRGRDGRVRGEGRERVAPVAGLVRRPRNVTK